MADQETRFNLSFDTLALTDTLLFFEYPRAFLCDGINSQKYYLFYETHVDTKSMTWLVTEVSTEERRKLLNGELFLQYPLLDRREVITVTRSFADDKDYESHDIDAYIARLPVNPVYRDEPEKEI